MRTTFWSTLFLVGCVGDKVGDTGETGNNGGDADTDADSDSDSDADSDSDSDTDSTTFTLTLTSDSTIGLTPANVWIEIVNVTCTGSTVTYGAEADGWTSGGQVFAQATGTAEPNRAETHDIRSFEFDEGQSWDHLTRGLGDASTLANPLTDWQRNTSTGFSCAADIQAKTMTYAFAIDDLNGNLSDCLVYGQDPSALINGTKARNSDPEFDLGACALAIVAD